MKRLSSSASGRSSPSEPRKRIRQRPSLMAKPSTVSPFLKLPGELRNEIYSYVIGEYQTHFLLSLAEINRIFDSPHDGEQPVSEATIKCYGQHYDDVRTMETLHRHCSCSLPNGCHDWRDHLNLYRYNEPWTWNASAKCDLGLLKVNRQIYQEASSILYGNNRFSITCDARVVGAVQRFLRNLRPNSFQNIRRLDMDTYLQAFFPLDYPYREEYFHINISEFGTKRERPHLEGFPKPKYFHDSVYGLINSKLQNMVLDELTIGIDLDSLDERTGHYWLGATYIEPFLNLHSVKKLRICVRVAAAGEGRWHWKKAEDIEDYVLDPLVERGVEVECEWYPSSRNNRMFASGKIWDDGEEMWVNPEDYVPVEEDADDADDEESLEDNLPTDLLADAVIPFSRVLEGFCSHLQNQGIPTAVNESNHLNPVASVSQYPNGNNLVFPMPSLNTYISVNELFHATQTLSQAVDAWAETARRIIEEVQHDMDTGTAPPGAIE
ncbi:MAG: hypothetical protein M1834_004299 [Cirrosporium novae-zelandiae]|nr:MAG: hypothetical protein M1834_004299 [Cirrosporium novae-zelandiae]